MPACMLQAQHSVARLALRWPKPLTFLAAAPAIRCMPGRVCAAGAAAGQEPCGCGGRAAGGTRPVSQHIPCVPQPGVVGVRMANLPSVRACVTNGTFPPTPVPAW